MLLLLLTIGGTIALSVRGETFTIGYLSTLDMIGQMQGSAINIAIESFRAKGWLQEHEFK